jgi:two-component system phosphate regulon sensor histidine kinase PhoR
MILKNDNPNLTRIGMILAPVVVVFGVLGLSGVLAGKIAFGAAVFAGGWIVWAAWHVKSEMDRERDDEGLLDESLRQEFVRQSRLAESYELILDSIPEPFLVLRADRRILHANQAVIELLGHDPIDADLTAAIRNPDVLNAAEAVLSGEEDSETVGFSRGGEVEQHLVARVVRLDGHKEGAAAAVIALHDLTAIHKAMEMRADFVANVSHELRTPLSTLVGCIETLQGPAKDDRDAQEKFLALMGEQGTRMTRLVEDLLSLSQIQANEHARPTESVHIQDIVPTVARMLEPDGNRKGVTFSLLIPTDLPPVRGDSDQLLQVFQNLMHNAVKYGRDGSMVQVVGREDDMSEIAISVADQGDGIPEEHLPRLTERFYRVDKARSRALGGTGLGLAIVKHILNRHKGRLQIDSEVDVGSTFTVFLPVWRDGPSGRHADMNETGGAS